MRVEKLNLISKIIAGQSPESSTYNTKGDGLPFFQGKADFQDKYPRVRIWCNSKKRKEAEPGDILISVRAPVGSVNICDQKSIVGRGLSAIRPKSELHGEYLYFYLKSNEERVASLGTGSTFKAITQDTLGKVEIPLPPLDDQIRIAHLLSKVEGLIAQRKQHLQQLDELLKSVFLEMFGDPVRNEKAWTLSPFSKLLLEIESGQSPVCEAREASAREWGVLKLGAVTKCYFQENENKALPAGIEPQIRHEVKEGDLLFGRKNTYELVGACAYVFRSRQKLLMPDLIFRFVFRDDAEVNPIFIWKLLTAESQRKKIQSLAAGAAGSMPNISKTNLKQAVIPVPPLELQNQFAAIVKKVDSIKSRYQKSLTELEALYGALSQKAFKGELDLSRVPLPVESTTVDTERLNHERHEKHEISKRKTGVAV